MTTSYLASSTVASRHQAEAVSDSSLDMAAVDSTLLETKPGDFVAVEERIRAIAHTVRFVGSDHCNVHIFQLRKLISAIGLAIPHAGERHAGSK